MHILPLFSLSIGLLPSLFLGGYAYAQQSRAPVKPLVTQLKNGLKVAIVPDDLAPVVQVRVVYQVGSAQAPKGFPGTAHALEHMMFNGTRTLSRDQLAVLSARLGDHNNAETTTDSTQYYFEVPARDLDTILKIESDRMKNLDLNDREWAHERGAIEQEVARDQSDPLYRYFEKLRAILFKDTPYERDALGDRTSFDKTDSALLNDFYKTWYAPNHAVLVIAGDVDPQKTLRSVERYFDALGPDETPKTQSATVTPKPLTPQKIELPTDLPVSLVAFGWRMPGLNSPDYASARILSDLINLASSPLTSLTPQGKALGASYSYMPDAQAGTAMAYVAFPKDQNPKNYKKLLETTLAQLGRFSDTELANAKKSEIAALEYAKNSVDGLAQLWGNALGVQNLATPDDLKTAYENVTRESVLRVAQEYLKDAPPVFAVLTPSGKIAPTGMANEKTPETRTARPQPDVTLPAWAESALGKPEIPSPPVAPVRYKLSNGLTLLVKRETVSPTVELFGHIEISPALQDPPHLEGISALSEQMFEYGSTTRDRIALASAFDNLAAAESAGTEFSLSALKEDFPKALPLLAEHELHPRVTAHDFNVARLQLAQSVEGEMGTPAYKFGKSLKAALLPKNDPALRHATPQSIARIQRKDVLEFYKSVYRPDKTTLFVIGDIDPEQARAQIERYFGNWKNQGATPDTVLPPVPLNEAKNIAVQDPGRSQDDTELTELVSAKIDDPDHAALLVGTDILGTGFSSRLLKSLRVEKGLAYSASSDISFNRNRTSFSIDFGTDPDKLDLATQSAIKEIEDLRTRPVPYTELENAKAGMLRRQALSDASFDRIASDYLRLARLELPLDYPSRLNNAIFHVSSEDIRDAFKSRIDPKRFVRASLVPQQGK